MFIFHRHRSGQPEVYSILLPEGGVPDSERFGNALRFSVHDELYHEVGMVVLIHGEKGVDYLLMCKNGLSDEEQERLYRELEHLVGKEVHAMGAEPIYGWYAFDTLRDWTPPAKPKSKGRKKP